MRWTGEDEACRGAIERVPCAGVESRPGRFFEAARWMAKHAEDSLPGCVV